MRIEPNRAPCAPLCRLRLQFGNLRGYSPDSQLPLIVALPFGTAGDNRLVVHIDPGEHIGADAEATLEQNVKAGGSVVFAFAGIQDAFAGYLALARFVGLPVADGARVPA